MKQVILILLIGCGLLNSGSYGFTLYPGIRTDNDTISPPTVDSTIQASPIIKWVSNWKSGGNGSLNISQGYLSHWAEGGQSSISSILVLQLFANQKINKYNWDNSMEIKYGLLKSGDLDIRKNEDKIEFSSKLGYNAIYKLFYSLNLDFKTQLDYGYEYPNDTTIISAFMSPASAIISLGLDFKPNEKYSFLISPLTTKTTYVLNPEVNPVKFGLEEGQSIKTEMGAFVKTLVKVDLTKEILLTNRLDFFTNYLHNPQNIDVNWQMNLTLKVNKYINTTINMNLIYDDDILLPVERTRINDQGIVETYMAKSKMVQFKELLAIGLNYSI